MEYWEFALQIVALAVFVYYYFHRKYSYWADRGVKGPAPFAPLGNMGQFLRFGQAKLERDWFAQYGKVYGIYQGVRPLLTILDHELIKQVMVKDFQYFVNHDVNFLDNEMWNSNLFNSEDEQWRRIRAIVSPTFSTGKLRGMHGLMNRQVDKLAEYFTKTIQSNDGKMNMKEVITGFTIDVIAATSFATDSNANDDRAKKNPFLENGLGIFTLKPLRFMSVFVMPKKFNRWIGNSMGIDDKYFDFFINLSKEIIKQRKVDKANNKVKRNDLVQLMMDAFVYEDENLHDEKNYDKLTATADNEGEVEIESKSASGKGFIKKSLSESEIIAQCILFFFAGFETTATTISNSLYFLAINPDVQERLASELSQVLDGTVIDSDEYNDKVNHHIPYLEAVMKETLRMCPPVVRLQRRVGIDGYKLAGIVLEKNAALNISTIGVHYNAEYYPEPDRFNPDRFMPENKHNLVPYTYLPFGVGPRNCIGMRFAYQEIKLCLAKIVRQFQFSPTAETKIPLEFNKLGVLSAKDIPLRVNQR